MHVLDTRIRDFCASRGHTCHIDNVEQRGDYTYMKFVGASQPSQLSFSRADAGACMINDKVHHSTGVDSNLWYFHGTDMSGLLGVICRGNILSWGQLCDAEAGEYPHSPDGVYSYADYDISCSSCYGRSGAVVCFESVGFQLSEKYIFAFGQSMVPEGTIGRMSRSEFKRSGAKGLEKIHNPKSIRLLWCRANTDFLQIFLED